MLRGMIAGTVLLVVLVGCIEIQQWMIPDSDPDARFNYDFDTDGGAEDGDTPDGDGNTNDNTDANANDNADTNTNDNADDNTEPDMDALVEQINAGSVGDIPAISSSVQQVTTSSGLRYFDVEPGRGDVPQQDSTVTVSYTGWLAEDGTEFDSNDLAQFNLQSVIEGWTEGLSTMQVGGTRRLIIPPELGYGSRGAPPSIPANAWLVFDVDLLEFE